jgi:CheY-like chemotaxis protein
MNLMSSRIVPLRILWLEDSDDDVFFLKNAMKGSGLPITLEHVWDGQEGINTLQRQEFTLPDGILTDIRMPRMDGLAFTQLVRSNPLFQWLPIFVLSTSGLARDIESGLNSGVNGYFTKPTTPKDWLVRLTEIYDTMIQHAAARRAGVEPSVRGSGDLPQFA